MRPVLQNQPQIEALSSALLGALRALVAAIQTGWNAQHKGDGTHDAITATALTVTPGVSVFGKIRLTVGNYLEPPATGGIVHNIGSQDVGIGGVSYLRINAVTNPLQITGIDATGRQQGDLLLVVNADDSLAAKDIWLLGENAGSVAENRFCDTVASASGAGGNVIIQGARGVWLVYDFQINSTVGISTPRPRWRVIAYSA